MSTTIATLPQRLKGLSDDHGACGAEIASGGQAVVFALDRRDRVYKCFKKAPHSVEEQRELSARLRLLVGFGRRVFVERREALSTSPESSFCWPLDLVEGAGAPLGLVMPRASDDFFAANCTDLTFDHLYLWRATPQPASVRIPMLISVLRSFAAFQRSGLVHGDIQPKNILWSRSRVGRILILDVDGVHREGDPYYGYVQTSEWEDPRVKTGQIPGHDMASDRFALLLLVARGLLGSRFAPGPSGAYDPIADDLVPRNISDTINVALRNPLDANARAQPLDVAMALERAYFPLGQRNCRALALADVVLARRRRAERRSGSLGPPYTSISNALKAGGLCH